jgi:hypothetical protein
MINESSQYNWFFVMVVLFATMAVSYLSDIL